METAANHALIKQINRAKVLNAIRVHSPVSRSEIAGYAELDKKSITNFIGELAKARFVEEVGKRKADKGRPLTLLSFHRTRQGVIGIGLEPEGARGILLNLYGELLQSARAEYPADCGIDAILKAVRQVYRDLKSGCGQVLGVGFAVPGIPQEDGEGRTWDSFNLPGLKGVRLDRRIAAFIPEPTFFEEASLAHALAEKWFGLGRGAAAFVSVDLGIGVGAGIIQDRRLYRGAAGFSGEIGHVLVERGGLACRCGNRGCLEAYLSERRLLAEINTASPRASAGLADVDPTSRAVRDILADAGGRLGLALSYLLNVICPPLFILSGPLARFESIVVPEVWRVMRSHSLAAYAARTRIQVSTLRDPLALGAASLALSDLFEVRGHYYV